MNCIMNLYLDLIYLIKIVVRELQIWIFYCKSKKKNKLVLY